MGGLSSNGVCKRDRQRERGREKTQRERERERGGGERKRERAREREPIVTWLIFRVCMWHGLRPQHLATLQHAVKHHNAHCCVNLGQIESACARTRDTEGGQEEGEREEVSEREGRRELQTHAQRGREGERKRDRGRDGLEGYYLLVCVYV